MNSEIARHADRSGIGDALVVVFLENAGSGGKTAAPVAGELVRAWHEHRS